MENTKVVVITGCFDIIHVGHVRMFEFARHNFPKHIITVLVDSDERIRKNKGETRPINTYIDRIHVLSAFMNVDHIHRLETDDTIINMCKEYNPIRIIGEEYKNKEIIGKEFCSAIVYFNKYKDLSTTKIIESLK